MSGTEKTKPRRVELNAPQALHVQQLFTLVADARAKYDEVERQMQAALANLTKDVAKKDDERTLWRLDVGEKIVELVEVLNGP